VPTNEPLTVYVELRFDGAAPTGHVCLPEGGPRAFSGWMGLVCAIDELVTESPETVRSET
jgi:hypothetical protein